MADEPGSGWKGDAPEREWAEAMAYYVKEKMLKATADGFVRYQANWLIVYNNWPLPAIDRAKAGAYLVPFLAQMCAFSVFDAVFVHDESHVCEFREAPVIHAVIHAVVKPGFGLHTVL